MHLLGGRSLVRGAQIASAHRHPPVWHGELSMSAPLNQIAGYLLDTVREVGAFEGVYAGLGYGD